MIYRLTAKQLLDHYERNYSYLGLISKGHKADYTFLYIVLVTWQVVSIALWGFLERDYLLSYSIEWYIYLSILLLSLILPIFFIRAWMSRKHTEFKAIYPELFDNTILNPKKLFDYRMSKITEYLENNNLLDPEIVSGIMEDIEEEQKKAQRRNVGRLVLAGGIIAMAWSDIRAAYLLALGVHGSGYESYFVLIICIVAFFTINALIGSVKEMEYGKWIHYRDLIYILKKINCSNA